MKNNNQKKPEKEFIGLVSFMSVLFVAFVPEGMKEGVSGKPTPLKKKKSNPNKTNKHFRNTSTMFAKSRHSC